LASFQQSIILKSKKAVCADQNNPDLFKKVMTGTILCLPVTIGSTTGGLALETAVQMGIAPLAMLFSDHIDSLAAAGVILADVWVGKRIIVVDQLGKEFLSSVEQGQKIEVFEDGRVELQIEGN
jgi:predicted aconitase with swiveling domain